ncbi:hypothetical protein RHMOL_Rhmol01G0131800 [Rhododendron molle]|uniref:Uncharacterized protein n=1 Tax=Rhododendron molle TaxID=49168 RepID=A0ACC0Q1I6_RHOML|nr:hypothetical protein RHMOL_Rhmol01G0131800 [Rhododendron molle]
MASDLGFSVVTFESDCKILINCINEPKSSCPWEIAALIDDIKSWASSRQLSFVWCCQEQNRSAHWLASNCLNRKILVNSGCIPPGLRSLLDRDSLSL